MYVQIPQYVAALASIAGLQGIVPVDQERDDVEDDDPEAKEDDEGNVPARRLVLPLEGMPRIELNPEAQADPQRIVEWAMKHWDKRIPALVATAFDVAGPARGRGRRSRGRGCAETCRSSLLPDDGSTGLESRSAGFGDALPPGESIARSLSGALLAAPWQ